MITCAYYLGYPVPALLYDAERGNTHSRLVIFEYFATLTDRGQAVPDDITKFVAKHLRLVIEGKQKPAEMFNPEGTKVKAYNPLPEDLINLADLGGDISAKFEKIGQIQFKSSKRGKAVERQYYQHKKYSERLSDIQTLLDERRTTTDPQRAGEILAKLQSLTSLS